MLKALAHLLIPSEQPLAFQAGLEEQRARQQLWAAQEQSLLPRLWVHHNQIKAHLGASQCHSSSPKVQMPSMQVFLQ